MRLYQCVFCSGHSAKIFPSAIKTGELPFSGSTITKSCEIIFKPNNIQSLKPIFQFGGITLVAAPLHSGQKASSAHFSVFSEDFGFYEVANVPSSRHKAKFIRSTEQKKCKLNPQEILTNGRNLQGQKLHSGSHWST